MSPTPEEPLTPAQRYAAATSRGDAEERYARSQLKRFADAHDFPLDEFQVLGCRAVEEGRGVLVAAPTGAGKTIVGEFAVHMALATGRKCFYTTPIKALSNQKFHDLVAVHGADRVGLLTGDSSVNGEAPVVVMTTEVLRNMMYSGSRTLDGLGYVVMDEVHYLADRFRGGVWEEVIIHLPQGVQVVSLSATVSNAEEFGAWLGEVRGETDVIVSETRPVPLWQHMLVGTELHDLFVEDERLPEGVRVNPDLLASLRTARRCDDTGWRRADDGGPRGRRGRPRGRGGDSDGATRQGRPPAGGRTASRAEVIDILERQGLLPCITFIFSRAGCEGAVGQLLAWGTRLISEAEGRIIRAEVDQRVQQLGEEDLSVLGYWDFAEGLARGFAAHHAGMLPLFREIVEELFTAGRIKAVFATETLALGINMPARTVVLERLVKFNGDTHVDLSPAEYTQLTGRAGRRGIDVEGHAVVLAGRGVDPEAVAGLASTRTYPLRSSFRPTSNMAVNLVDRYGRDVARDLLESSFAQFQADRSVVGHTRAIRRNEEALAGYEEAAACDRGDFAAYHALRRQIGRLEKDAARHRSASRRAEAAQSLEALVAGDVIRVTSGRRAGRAVVLQPARSGARGISDVTLLTQDARVMHLVAGDIDEPVEPQGRIRVPKGFNPRQAKSRRDLAATMRAQVPDAPRLPEQGSAPSTQEGPASGPDTTAETERLRRQMRAHPCHSCPDREDHARWAERADRLARETAGLRRRVEGRTNTVSRQFDRICQLLGELGYLSEDGQEVTEQGRTLQRLYTEKDLLVAECLRQGVWQGLDAPGLAACVAIIVHESRRDGPEPAPRMPSQQVEDAYDAMVRVWSELEDLEAVHQLPTTSQPDAGIAWMVHRWAAGSRLELVLRDTEVSAGDFVRRCKQIVDLLGQIERAAPTPALAATARKATGAVLRGVVAADRLD